MGGCGPHDSRHPEARMSEDEAIRTAFHDVTAAQGGTHIADGGWMWLGGVGQVHKEQEVVPGDGAAWGGWRRRPGAGAGGAGGGGAGRAPPPTRMSTGSATSASYRPPSGSVGSR